jgi:alpha-D-xyloside xylohydrolase
MMRSHGTDAPREIYQFGEKGDPIYDAIEKYIHLRYLLLPYIYSVSWDVTKNKSSMTRALMMDFAHDKQALDINDEYLFGKAILVCPVTESMYSENSEEDWITIKAKEVYLPKGADWIDFWNGEKYSGGQMVCRETPIDIIPLYVRAGSIIPIGPKVQYANEKSWDSLEIRIYEGADGEFTLYEDENDNYNHENGMYSTIKFRWNDAKKILTIDDREGDFPGMLSERSFNIVRVDKNKGAGMDTLAIPDQQVIYKGKKIIVKM